MYFVFKFLLVRYYFSLLSFLEGFNKFFESGWFLKIVGVLSIEKGCEKVFKVGVSVYGRLKLEVRVDGVLVLEACREG